MHGSGDAIRLELLGPMAAWRQGKQIDLGPPKQRAVLGLLARRINDVVTFEEIVDAVWGHEVPRTAANGVHTYIAGLRRALEPGRGRRKSSEVLVSTGGGYALYLRPENIDVQQFVKHCAEARRRNEGYDPRGALDELDAALRLWRGEAYANVPGPFAELERHRLQELRLTAIEEWAAGMLALGRHREAVAVIAAAVAGEPLHEKLRWLLMLTLYRCGRPAQALDVYRKTERLLSRELGIEPGPDLRSLHSKILVSHHDLRAPNGSRPAPLSAPDHLPPAPVFTGRFEELAALREFVEREHARRPGATAVAVIEGEAGVGKTALALRLAHDLAGRFHYARLYVDLRGSSGGSRLSPADALGVLLGGLGVDENQIPHDLPARTAFYRSLLNAQPVLIVVDDAHDSAQVRPLIPSGPSCVLVTSRTRQAGLVARDGAFRLGLRTLDPSGVAPGSPAVAPVAPVAPYPFRPVASLVRGCRTGPERRGPGLPHHFGATAG